MSGHCNLSRFNEDLYTFVLGDNGTLLLIPRAEIGVKCELGAQGVSRLILELSDDVVIRIGVSRAADLKRALESDKDADDPELAWGTTRESRICAISCSIYADLRCRTDGESYHIDLILDRTHYSYEGEKDLPFDSCAVELTAGAWVALRDKIIAILAKVKE
jgi:hypothetical protein